MAQEDGVPLHASAGVAARQGVHISHRYPVEVAEDRLLEATGRHGKPQRGFGRSAGDKPVDEARREAVAVADPIDQPDVVPLTVMERAYLGIREHRCLAARASSIDSRVHAAAFEPEQGGYGST